MIILDTSVLVGILRKNAEVINKIKTLGDTPLFTTQICVMELFFGIESNKVYLNNQAKKIERLRVLNELLTRFTIFDLDKKSAIKTAELLGNLKLKGTLIDFRDAMIIGIGLANGINTFYTLNNKHFNKLVGITLIE
ncbi:MAG: type II toxin-antitoxin system VapC family toxin [Candidatus Heimdallarchaeota archaeon]|nr:type II toxin-antitoxin system VapC family toxin [Candidatus Heimdallarchaeota archaeon]